FSVLSAVSIPVLAALIVHLVRRARTANADERQSQEPVWWAGGATLFLFAAGLLVNLGPESGNYDDVVWYLSLFVLTTVPFAFLLGLLRTRPREATVRVAAARAGSSSGTFTTARNSAWSASPWTCGWRERSSGTTRRPPPPCSTT